MSTVHEYRCMSTARGVQVHEYTQCMSTVYECMVGPYSGTHTKGAISMTRRRGRALRSVPSHLPMFIVGPQ
jgi:hypothetical protein